MPYCQVQWEGRPVLSPTYDLSSDTNDPRRSSLDVALQVARVFLSVWTRHEDLDWLADDFSLRVAEELLCSTAETLDATFFLDDHYGVYRGVENRLETRFPVQVLMFHGQEAL